MSVTPDLAPVTCTCIHPDVPSVSADLADHFLSWLANNEDRWPLWLNLDAETEPMTGWADGGDPEELTVNGIREAMRACACRSCAHLVIHGLRLPLLAALERGSPRAITGKIEFVGAVLQVALWGRIFLSLAPEMDVEEDEDLAEDDADFDLEDQLARGLARGDAQDARAARGRAG